jgi:hypothetical protein
MAKQASVAESPASLWRKPNFTGLWFANVVSNAGTQITSQALPLILSATPHRWDCWRWLDPCRTCCLA